MANLGGSQLSGDGQIPGQYHVGATDQTDVNPCIGKGMLHSAQIKDGAAMP